MMDEVLSAYVHQCVCVSMRVLYARCTCLM